MFALRPAVQPESPPLRNLETEATKGRRVPSNPVVPVMALQLPYKGFVLFRYGPVAFPTAPQVNALQGLAKPVLGRLAFDHPVALS